jgi:hypothetical protein
MLSENKYDTLLYDLYPANGKDALLNEKINFLEKVRKEFQLVYADLEGKFIEKCDAHQKVRVLFQGNVPA